MQPTEIVTSIIKSNDQFVDLLTKFLKGPKIENNYKQLGFP